MESPKNQESVAIPTKLLYAPVALLTFSEDKAHQALTGERKLCVLKGPESRLLGSWGLRHSSRRAQLE